MVRSQARRIDIAWDRRFRKAAAGALWSAAFAAGFGSGQPVIGGEAMIDRRGDAPADTSMVQDDANRLSLFLDDDWTLGHWTTESIAPEESSDYAGKIETAGTREADEALVPNGSLDAELIQLYQITIEADSSSGPYIQQADGETAEAPPTDEGAASDATEVREAQFQLPQPSPEGEESAPQLPSRLVYEYGYGSQSEIDYRKDPDLDSSVDDDFLIAIPELNAHVIYRPTDWLETGLEMILQREFPVFEEHRVMLPNGDVEVSENRQLSLEVDQAFVRVKNVTDPLEFTVGRLNYEDYRHFVYDTSLDIVQVKLKHRKYRVEATVGRENLVSPDLLQNTQQDNINTYMLYMDYRGIEDINFAGYTILRDDQRNEEGKPWWLGLRSHGFLSEEFSYWVDLAYMGGEDDTSRNFSAYAFDVGGTYRFTDLPYNPNVTLGFALATGDGNSDDNKNNEFRQTGLQSNETNFAGVSEFLIYGETLDPELCNLKILTAGVGARPAPGVSVDLVFHKYWLYEKADELCNSGITALMNQDPTRSSKDVGNALDIVIGLRSLFGIRRLGMDLRTGLFFPGDAFRNEDAGGNFSDADRGISMVTTFWW